MATAALLAGSSSSPGRRSPEGMSFPAIGARTLGKGAMGRTQSAAKLELADVRALAADGPLKGEGAGEVAKNPHDALMQRLKSRAARHEAESTRAFLASYAASTATSASEAKLDALLKACAHKAEELRRRTDEWQLEVEEASRKLKNTYAMTSQRASDMELTGLNAFERGQRRIQEDKKEEEITRLRDEMQALHAKAHRKLQSELVELRDYKVLLREYRRVRVEKLHDTLGKVTDGRQLRNCVREMIRNGSTRILPKLEASGLHLEPWMYEVLVNSCHVELRIEDAEQRLLTLQRQALHPVRGNVEVMLAQSRQERFDKLTTKIYTDRVAGSEGVLSPDSDTQGTLLPGGPSVETPVADQAQTTTEIVPAATLRPGSGQADQQRASEKMVAEMRAAEGDVRALRRLLADMRRNSGAIICNYIRQAEKNGGGGDALDWGKQVLSLLVSQDFAKVTIKELQKSAPHAQMLS